MISGENMEICTSKESDFEDSHPSIQDTNFATNTTTLPPTLRPQLGAGY